MAIDPKQISKGKGPGQHCHKLIRATAIEMAGALYDMLMQNNEQWAEWKALNPGLNTTQLEIKFIEGKWGELIEDARATLGAMLAQNVPEELKQTVFDALVADNALRVHRLRHYEEKAKEAFMQAVRQPGNRIH